MYALRDRKRIRPPVPVGTLRSSYYAPPLTNIKLNPWPGHVPRSHFEPQTFPCVELRRSLATCNVEGEDPGYGPFLLGEVLAGQVISWYSKDIVSLADAERLKAQGNRHLRIVKQAVHCLNSEPRAGRGYDYYAARHELAGFANASNAPNAYFVDVGKYTVLVAIDDLAPGDEVFVRYNF